MVVLYQSKHSRSRARRRQGFEGSLPGRRKQQPKPAANNARHSRRRPFTHIQPPLPSASHTPSRHLESRRPFAPLDSLQPPLPGCAPRRPSGRSLDTRALPPSSVFHPSLRLPSRFTLLWRPPATLPIDSACEVAAAVSTTHSHPLSHFYHQPPPWPTFTLSRIPALR